MMTLEEIRNAADEAWSKIDHNPDRICELDDDGLSAIALNVKTTRPIAEQALVALAGGVDEANAALARVERMAQPRLINLVRSAHIAVKATGPVTINQWAAIAYDALVGCGAVHVEQERRHANKAGRMN